MGGQRLRLGRPPRTLPAGPGPGAQGYRLQHNVVAQKLVETMVPGDLVSLAKSETSSRCAVSSFTLFADSREGFLA